MTVTRMPELRREPRDPIVRRAQLFCDGAWVPCLIQDMSPNGFGITTTRDLSVGQVCGLRCEAYPGQEFQCSIEIRHASEASLGASVADMNEAGRRVCMELMRDYHSDRKSRNH